MSWRTPVAHKATPLSLAQAVSRISGPHTNNLGLSTQKNSSQFTSPCTTTLLRTVTKQLLFGQTTTRYYTQLIKLNPTPLFTSSYYTYFTSHLALTSPYAQFSFPLNLTIQQIYCHATCTHLYTHTIPSYAPYSYPWGATAQTCARFPLQINAQPFIYTQIKPQNPRYSHPYDHFSFTHTCYQERPSGLTHHLLSSKKLYKLWPKPSRQIRNTHTYLG